MEQADVQSSSQLGVIKVAAPPSPLQEGWTSEEKKLFENAALVEFDPLSPNFFENVASRVPSKSVEDVKSYYMALFKDVEMIESGQIAKNEEVVAAAPPPADGGVTWTEDEHQLFLMGLERYGMGEWCDISRYYVITKSPAEVASHAHDKFHH